MSYSTDCLKFGDSEKLKASASTGLIAAISVLLIFNPYTFDLVNRIVDGIFGTVNAIALLGCPTTLGLFLHAGVVFLVAGLLAYIIMKPGDAEMQCCKSE